MNLYDTILFPETYTLSMTSEPLIYNIKYTSVGYGEYSNMCAITKVEMVNYIYRD